MIGHEAIAAHHAPTENGTYVAEVYFGWKILEYHDGEWWHTQKVGRWTACAPSQWVGPLPVLKGRKGAETPAKVFDL